MADLWWNFHASHIPHVGESAYHQYPVAGHGSGSHAIHHPPPPPRYHQPPPWTSGLPDTPPATLDSIISMMRRMKARLDAYEQRLAMAQPLPWQEPDPSYGMPSSWQSPPPPPSPVEDPFQWPPPPPPPTSVTQQSTPIQQGYAQQLSALQPGAVSESAEGALMGNGYEFGIDERSEEVAAKLQKPVSEEKVVDKNPISLGTPKYGAWNNQFSGGKIENKVSLGTKFSLTDQKTFNWNTAGPAKKQRLGEDLNVADGSENSSDSDKEQSLMKYYSADISLADTPEEKKKARKPYETF